MTVDIHIDVRPCPKDDFYFQWCYIYWWQMKINVEIMLNEGLTELGFKGDVQ